MNLLVHFGIYKTGSSYLQYILANSRPYLVKNNIFFPLSKNDPEMLQGRISSGNADGLEEALKKESIKECNKIFKTWINNAKKNHCNNVLISAEALVHQLAKPNRLQIFIECAKGSGFDEIKAMGFFRDIISHAISTYKHRAKSGRLEDYENWIKNIYETPTLLKKLAYIRTQNFSINWDFRKFFKSSDLLLKSFFEEWLGIRKPEFLGLPKVNESVTLSEILILNELNKIYPAVIDFFVQDLKQVDIKLKAKDSGNEEFLRSVFTQHLKGNSDLIQTFNSYLPSGEKLELISTNETSQSELFAVLTPHQLQILSKRVAFFQSFKGNMILNRRRIVKFIVSR